MAVAEEADLPHVVLLRSFVNTLDVEEGTDRLSDLAGLRGWLEERGLVTAAAQPQPVDLRRARALRDGLRHVFTAHERGAEPELVPELDAAAAELPLRVRFHHGPRLAPAHGGVPGALEQLLVAVSDSRADGTWPRLKLCAAADCRWSFYDVSKNRSRTWCDMAVCGNRNKTHTYRARRRSG